MGVRIDEINVEKAGPITELQMALGPFNLIYGRNEQGKTFLVEFLIRSLFRNLSGWSLRTFDSRGKVVISGLGDRPLSLTPSSRRKLEDYLSESETGLPTRISRLLVVKGAELGFEDDGSPGVSQSVLKEFLSGQGVLDDVQNRISKTVRGAEIVDGRIEGHQRGEIARIKDAQSSIRGIDKLFEQVEEIYSGGERRALETTAKELNTKIAVQEAAQRHQANLLSRRVKELQTQIDLLPEEELGQLDGDVKNHTNTHARIYRLEMQLEGLTQKSEDYEWLEKAIPLYEQRGKQGKAGGGVLFPILIAFVLVAAIVTTLLNFPLGTIFLIVVAAVLSWFYWRQLRTAVDHAIDIDEIKKLETEFELRFGCPLSGLPIMQKAVKVTEEAYHEARARRDDLQEAHDDLAKLHDKIAPRLRKITGNVTEPEQWEEVTQGLFGDRRMLHDELTRHRMTLAVLGVSEADYQAEPASEQYDRLGLQALREELGRAEESLRAKNEGLEELKQRICQETQDEITVDWAILIHHLQQEREEAVADYREQTAQVMAGILVNKALDEIRAQEVNKIQEKLASTQVSGPIQRISRRYTGVSYDDGRLMVTDPYGGFQISDLSTGAREQVLLGLRLGFAAHILGRDRLFLLLDDAFQHADWQRRDWLMDQMVVLAQDGWQIIYFTMDDHIRGLFQSAGQARFPEQYRYYELDSKN